MTNDFEKKLDEGELIITVKYINVNTTSFILYQNRIDLEYPVEIGICDISIRRLCDYEENFINKNKINLDKISSTFNIDWIEIYKDKIYFYESYKGIGTFFLNYCLEYLSKRQNNKIYFSTLDNCISPDCKSKYNKIYFYKRLGYEWIYFDEKENKPSGPEMIKFL